MTEVWLRMLLGATIGLMLVLLLRRPARRAFGAGPAFTLWLLPLALACAPLLPGGMPSVAAWSLPALVVTPHAAMTAQATQSVDWARWLVVLWLLGATAGIARLLMHYVRLLHGMRRAPFPWTRWLTDAAAGLDPRRARVHAAGPAVLWALPRALILLPADFAERFDDAATRDLVLPHELTHARRGDACWTLAMEIASALLWFHPLAWLARSRFRLDQELACDAASLRALPSRTARYARALLDSVAVQPVPALIPWLAEPQLKERLAMITRIPPGALRRRAGFLAIAAVLAGGLFIAGGRAPVHAATPVSSSTTSMPPSVDVAFKNRSPPQYPVDALRNGEQGTVLLRVYVNAVGNVTKVGVDSAKTTTSSAELQAAAVTAAEGWKFIPGEKDGKSAGGWVTIPVTFSLHDEKPCPAGQGHTLKPPFECAPLQPPAKSS